MTLLALLACAPAAQVLPATRGPKRYDVVVVGANGERSISSLVVLEVTPGPEAARTFATVRSEGTWEEHGEKLSFDSDAPSRRDPWFLRMQHLVASVPAIVELDVTGAPAALREEPAWRTAARELIYAADVPVQALEIGESLLDPSGLVRDLRRDFPGRPPSHGDWVRDERLAGIEASRVERCTVEQVAAETTWTCVGRADGPTEGAARLHDLETRTVLVADRRGLRLLESTWSGTLVLLDPSGTQVVDRPVAERRLVQRR